MVVKFEEWENTKMNPIGSVEHVLGRPGDMRAEGDAILAQSLDFHCSFQQRSRMRVKEIDRSPYRTTEVSQRRDDVRLGI